MKPQTIDYGRVRASQSQAQPQIQRQHQQVYGAIIPNPQVHIPVTGATSREDDMTATETEKALKELISGNMNDDEAEDVEIEAEDKLVEGFKEGIELLDHQVLGRNWMAGRENPDEKRYGGILADDMG